MNDVNQERKITPGIYQHFKGNLYQVLFIAQHTETDEQMVVYQVLYGDYGLYVRPYDMFASKVDHEKYPNVSLEEVGERTAHAMPVKSSLVTNAATATDGESVRDLEVGSGCDGERCSVCGEV